MSDTRISREEIKSIARDRKNERADTADTNEGKVSGCSNCENGKCNWHDDH